MMGRYLIAALIGASLLVALYGYGHKSGYAEAQAEAQRERLAAVSRAIEQAEAIARQDAELLAHHEVERARIRTVFQTIDREVIRYVEAHRDDPDCLDADGVRLWSAANAGDFPAAAGEPAGGVPATTTAADTVSGGGPAGQPRGGYARLLGVPADAPGPGEVGARRGKTVIPIYAVLRQKQSPALGGGPRP